MLPRQMHQAKIIKNNQITDKSGCCVSVDVFGLGTCYTTGHMTDGQPALRNYHTQII